MEKRHKLFINQDYDTLYKRIMVEQNKIDVKTMRKLNRSKRNGVFNVRDKEQDDLVLEKDELKQENKEEKEEKKIDKFELQKEKEKVKRILNKNVSYNALVNSQSKLLYYKNDNLFDMAKRLNRCIYHAKRGEWKKADKALDPQKVVNIYENGNLTKAKSKFPNEKRNEYKFHDDVEKIQFDEDDDKLEICKAIMARMNKKASSGKDGIDNKQLLLMMERDDVYTFVARFV